MLSYSKKKVITLCPKVQFFLANPVGLCGAPRTLKHALIALN